MLFQTFLICLPKVVPTIYKQLLKIGIISTYIILMYIGLYYKICKKNMTIDLMLNQYFYNIWL